VNGVTYDDELGLWLAFGWEEMWTSADGEAWERHAVESEELGARASTDPQFPPTSVLSATRHAGRLFAAGTWYGQGDDLGLLVWSSTGGESWEILPQGGLAGYAAQGIASNGSVLAVASHYYGGGDGVVRTSVDGRSWVEHQPAGTAGMLGIYADGDGFVAVGYREVGAANSAATIWTSADGITWEDVSPIGAAGKLRSVSRTPGGVYVAAGSGASGAVAVWRSEDRLHWARSDIAAPSMGPGLVDVALAASETGLLLVAYTQDGWGAWESNDGMNWGRVPPVAARVHPPYGTVVATNGDRVIVFAGETSDLWVGRIVPAD